MRRFFKNEPLNIITKPYSIFPKEHIIYKWVLSFILFIQQNFTNIIFFWTDNHLFHTKYSSSINSYLQIVSRIIEIKSLQFDLKHYSLVEKRIIGWKELKNKIIGSIEIPVPLFPRICPAPFATIHQSVPSVSSHSIRPTNRA